MASRAGGQLERGTRGDQHCVPSSREPHPFCSMGCQPQAGVPCQPQRLDGVELRVAENRRWSGQTGWTRGKQNESEGMRRFGSAPVSGNPAPRSPRDIGTRGHRTWTSALVHTCQPGNRWSRGLKHHILFLRFSKLFSLPLMWCGHRLLDSRPLRLSLRSLGPLHPPWSRDARGRAARARGARLISAEGGACAGPGAAARPLKSRRLRLSSFLFSLSGPFV